ncbi:CCA tRNA nucleotidyltransferase [Salinibaculum rarum]|uniref:CCA tRNA nucleotidyltransferase n=1 Tax=Salinibaculum rarum TaxID=3058903 RepID=UPI00265EA874|nr:CCA tRNA nucleotidyltransferase [Salinibaculum sp. KK48]
MTDEFDAVVERVRERVTPTPDEREQLQAVAAELTERAETAVADLPVEADIVQVGSTARQTWIAGDRDIDLFVSFPPELDREQLEEYGLDVGHAVLPNGHEEYAEHPYVVGEYDGYEVDCVPCYAVEDATQIQSAVDRTPFHTRYLDDRLTADLADDVRVCKQFFKGIGVYGSDLRTRGFSGFLTELLVLEYGGFRKLIEAVADWHPPVEFDPEDHGEESFPDPLVVIDPTDPERNVAAVLSEGNVARLQHFARELLAAPDEALFEHTDPAPLDADGVRTVVADRKTTPLALHFEAPDLVDDQLWPQLEKSRTGIASELDRRGFDVFRSAAFATGETAVLLFELAVAERPAVERHDGPPVHVREHATGFFEQYDGERTAPTGGPPYGPYIDGDRYVVERAREFTNAVDVLASEVVFETALGAHVESALEGGYDLLVGGEIASLADEFGVQFRTYFDPRP